MEKSHSRSDCIRNRNQVSFCRLECCLSGSVVILAQSYLSKNSLPINNTTLVVFEIMLSDIKIIPSRTFIRNRRGHP